MMRLRRAILRWLVAVVALPVAAEVADRVGRRLEAGRGRTATTRALRSGAAGLRRAQAKRRRG